MANKDNKNPQNKTSNELAKNLFHNDLSRGKEKNKTQKEVAKTNVSKARLAALEAISIIIKNESFARNSLEKVLQLNSLSKEDRAFAYKLSLGVIQTMGTLDDVIYRCVESKNDIKINVLNALRISTYEIIYLEKEAYVAVDQGVELVKAIQPKAKGLANLILHKVVRLKKDFPFGDPREDLLAFSRVYSMPTWISKLLINDLGEENGMQLISSCNGQPPMYVFVNTNKWSMDQAEKFFSDNGCDPVVFTELCGVKLSSCLRLKNQSAIRNKECRDRINEGYFIICDAASQGVVEYAIDSIDKPVRMLDLCCGIGNKSLMFSSLSKQRFQTQFDMTCVDNICKKLEILKKRAQRFDAEINKTLCADVCKPVNEADGLNNDELYDLVFVDSPCSGLGTLRRHPELKFRLQPSDISEMAKKSLTILQNASQLVKPGGRLVYATCTVTKSENKEVCTKFLDSQFGKTFEHMEFCVDGKNRDHYYTQTLGGLNDCHFACAFVKLK